MLMIWRNFDNIGLGDKIKLMFLLAVSVGCAVGAVIVLIHRIITYKFFAADVTARITDAEKMALPTGRIMAVFTCEYTFKNKNYTARVEKYDHEAEARDKLTFTIDSRRPQKVLYHELKIVSTIGLILVFVIGAVIFFTLFLSLYGHVLQRP